MLTQRFPDTESYVQRCGLVYAPASPQVDAVVVAVRIFLQKPLCEEIPPSLAVFLLQRPAGELGAVSAGASRWVAAEIIWVCAHALSGSWARPPRHHVNSVKST